MAAKTKPKARGKGAGTIEQRGTGDFIGYFRTTVDGVRKKVGICSGATEREVKMKLNAWNASGGLAAATAPPPEPESAPIVTGPFVEEWFDGKLTEWAQTTCDTNRQNFEKHVRPNKQFWNTPVNRIGYKEIIQFRDSIGGSQNTKRNVMRLVRPAFDRAVKLEIISLNPFSLLDKSDKPKRSKSRVVCFKTEQMQKLLRHVEQPGFDPLWRALVLFGFDLGAEPEEFLGVQVGDFDWKLGRVHVQRTCVEAGGEIVVKDEMKADKRNRKERLAPRTLAAIAVLTGKSRRPSEHLFSPTGKPWSYDAFIKLWRKLLVAAEVEHVPPLAMRHTMASLMLSRGVPLPAVSKRLGHANIVTTLTHYVEAMPSDSDRLGTESESLFTELLASAGSK